jgi:metal-responsive CopG/Arc/MetJ family transcriptional regulator
MATVKTAISIQEPLFHEVDALAREMSISRSQLFVLAVQEYLRQIRNRELLKRINQAYSGEPDHQEKALADRKKSYHLRMVEGEW